MTNNTGIDQVTLEVKINFLEPLKVEPFTAKGFCTSSRKNYNGCRGGDERW